MDASDGPAANTDGDVENVARAVSLMMESASFLNPASLLAVINTLAECVHATQVRPKVFSRTFSWLSASKDPLLIQILLLLQMRFGSQLVSDQETVLLSQRLLVCINDATSPVENRSLMLAWLSHIIDSVPKSDNDVLGMIEDLLPHVFDSVDIMTWKVQSLALLMRQLEPKSADENETFDVLDVQTYDVPRYLMESLVCFSDYTSFPSDTRQVRSLFHTLYLLYLEGVRSKSRLCTEIYDFVVKAGLRFSKFIVNSIHLSECISQTLPDDSIRDGRSFQLLLLEEFKDALVASTDKDFLHSLDHYVWLLDRLAKEKTIYPGRYLVRLHLLLKRSPLCATGDWVVGTSILKVCRTLIYSQSAPVILRPLGDVLRLLWMTFADIDIRDNARFYYMLLTNVAGEPLHEILKPHTATKNNLSTMMTDNLLTSSKYRPADAVTEEANIFLKMYRLPEASQKDRVLNVAAQAPPLTANTPADVADQEDALRDYKKWFGQFAGSAEVHLQYRIAFIPQTSGASSSMPDVIYAVAVVVAKHARFHDIPASMIDALAQNSTRDDASVVTLRVRPRDPVPAELGVSVEYTLADGTGTTMVLAPINITFPDMLLPLVNVYQGMSHELFSALWADILTDSKIHSESLHSVRAVLQQAVYLVVAPRFHNVTFKSARVYTRIKYLQNPSSSDCCPCCAAAVTYPLVSLCCIPLGCSVLTHIGGSSQRKRPLQGCPGSQVNARSIFRRLVSNIRERHRD